MRVILRIIAILAGLWALRDGMIVSRLEGLALAVGILWVTLWAGTALTLWRGIRPAASSGVLISLSLIELVLMGQWSEYGLILLAWMGLTVLVTSTKPREAVLSLRVLVSSVYIFAALSKVQPSWLRGDNMRYLIESRPQAELAVGFLPDPALVGIAAITVGLEFWIGIGLWSRRTRSATAILGITLHAALTILATRGGAAGLLHLIVLNFGLVMLYAMFWMPTPPMRHSSESRPAAA